MSLSSVSRYCSLKPWRVIVSWLVILGVTVACFAGFHGQTTTAIEIPGTPTTQVSDELKAHFPDASGTWGTIVFTTDNDAPFTADQKYSIAAAMKKLEDIDGVAQVVDPFTAQATLDGASTEVAEGKQKFEQLAQLTPQQRAAMGISPMSPEQIAAAKASLDDGQQLVDAAEHANTVSADQNAALGMVRFSEQSLDLPEGLRNQVMDTISDAHLSGIEVNYSTEIARAVPQLMGVSEVIGLVVAGLILLVMFASFLTAGLPLLAALTGIGVGISGAMAFSSLVEMNTITPILGLMLGLAVGIDYSLFIVNRHRTMYADGMELHDSIAKAGATSGRAVVFAGSTVMIALLALNLTGIPFLGIMGSVGAASILTAVLVAITLTPALLGLLGTKALGKNIRKAHLDTSENPSMPRPMSTWRAVLSVVASLGALALLAIPATDVRLGLPDGSYEPEGSTANIAYQQISKHFSDGDNAPLMLIAHLPQAVDDNEPATYSAQAAIAHQLMDTPDIRAVVPVAISPDRTRIAFKVTPKEGPNTQSTIDLVHRLRDQSPVSITASSGDLGRVDLAVAGNTSASIDVSEKLADSLPVYLAVVVGLSLIIMGIVFRSLLIPVIASAGFIASLAATLGVLVAVFQWGWGADLFQLTTLGPIPSFLPTVMIGILFGLAMDYQLFLTTGMREALDEGQSPYQAVASGRTTAARVVIAAAAIMVSVFAGFIFNDSATIKALGMALAVGIAIDAYLIRLILIPALLHLTGKAAWWPSKTTKNA